MLPKRRFGKEEQMMKSGFSKHFSMVRSPNRVRTPLKSAAKIRISSFVPPSEIFVWEGYNNFTHFFSIISVSIGTWPDFEYSRIKVPSLSRGAKLRNFWSARPM